MPRLLPAASVLLLLAACQGREQPYGTGPENSAAEPESGAAARPLAGVYADTVPCNDCQGIATRLTLKPDSLYVLQEQYLGRPDPAVYQRGPWRVRGQVLTLAPSGNAPGRSYQVAAENTLQLLDATGKPMPGGAQGYTLRYRSDGDLNEAGTRREFTGLYSGAAFTECGTDTRYTLTTGSLDAELARQYAAIRRNDGQPVFLRVSATVQAAAGSAEAGLLVDKILEIKPDPICPQR
ncbi:copper resistance protein NlpE N-terminal domain-containing protein [Hymenobacter sp. NST-14]|uniref:copper resistance protein NlpE n=1 Tax=Hymenobacter piscis TaxID=2839984 RepID=UPI001C01E2D5|nr:copper resistance protein NlpE [Hymenobacter piscis]MBT9394563.1 copper resistance protein NlpE N-terminal domain-containing protein [Hymenobacter piscis]